MVIVKTVYCCFDTEDPENVRLANVSMSFSFQVSQLGELQVAYAELVKLQAEKFWEHLVLAGVVDEK